MDEGVQGSQQAGRGENYIPYKLNLLESSGSCMSFSLDASVHA